MPESRRFSDDEVQQILERASLEDLPESGQPSTSNGSSEVATRGMTLQQLQEIAVEAGIDPAAVARAAERVARGELAPVQVRAVMGAPVAVAKTIELGTRVDDATWDRMVLLLRDTFGARGRVRVEGGLREWSNGNLSAVLEPTPQGDRLRVSTRKGDAAMFRALGNVGLSVAAVLTTWMVLRAQSGGWGPALTVLPIVVVAGLGGLAGHLRNFVALRRWGRERTAQMDALPERLFALFESSSRTLPPG
jgi:hypothetical protein